MERLTESLGLVVEFGKEEEKLLEVIRKLRDYEDIGLTPEEIKLMISMPETLWIIDVENDGSPIYPLYPVDGEQLEISGCFNWNCRNGFGDYESISVAGLGVDYFITKEDAEKALKNLNLNEARNEI